ncbi:AfsR/SARP family transcriptional regulator [Nonomuraea longispora]|uniref:AfsR/SARP family transcriptional regulator n=1 Tax=Nonomuraea longispora TaxID=1848320 RepID=A0A4R4NJG9_9ACTN|nr:BTAD domain-containing putative transcriptional regulator [Nonomuraea longispora]TDC07820.1 AfsR/SARP family transcriptional regulator [Nonomuraea longispora]
MWDDGLRFGILGPLMVRAGGRAVRLAAGKRQQFLATLLLNPNRVTPLDTVVEILWQGRPPRSAIANIRTYASSLRTMLGGIDRIIGDSVGYRLRVSPHELDMLTFTELIRQAESSLERHRPEIALKLFRLADGLWRGSPLEDVPPHPQWAGPLEQLAEQRLALLESLAALELAAQMYASVITRTRKFLSDHPFRERAWMLLILALYGRGRREEALAAYVECRQALREELGVEPSEELRTVQSGILNGARVRSLVLEALQEANGPWFSALTPGSEGLPPTDPMTAHELVDAMAAAGLVERVETDDEGQASYLLRLR